MDSPLRRGLIMRDATVSYEERFVAYVGILGWSEASAVCSNEVIAAAELIHSIAAAKSSYAKAKVKAESDKYKWINPIWLDSQAGAFSDNIVLSNHANSGPRILNSAGDLQRGLLAIGFLCRGAITFGKVFHRDAIVMGPALVEAVRLEKLADTPRIIVAPEALDAMSRDYVVESERELYDDGTEFLAVNPIATPAIFLRDHERMYREALSIDLLEQSIARGLQVSAGNERHFQKWQYMSRVFPDLLERSIGLSDGSSQN